MPPLPLNIKTLLYKFCPPHSTLMLVWEYKAGYLFKMLQGSLSRRQFAGDRHRQGVALCSNFVELSLAYDVISKAAT